MHLAVPFRPAFVLLLFFCAHRWLPHLSFSPSEQMGLLLPHASQQLFRAWTILGLALNSLVWTRIGSAIIYDADRGFPGPGFRLGFPSIQPQFSTPQTGVYSYLAIMPSGRRVELRQVSDRIYEAVDSSYLELDDGGNGLLLRAADGSQMSYLLINGEYRCTGIKDRNGNFITIDYNQFGRIVSITDTMNRVITFEYDSNQRLQSIKQNRSAGLHTWATFGYTTLVVATKFRDETNKPLVVQGLPANNTISVLSQIGLNDGSRYAFEYTSWGQVHRIKHKAADGHDLSSVSYNLPLTNALVETDCPRFTQRLDAAGQYLSSAEFFATYTARKTVSDRV